MLEESLDLGAEQDMAVGGAVHEQWFEAEPVAREEQLLSFDVNDGHTDHPAHVVEEPDAVVAVKVQEHLAVGVTREKVLAELAAQLAMVVDLAVRCQDHRSVPGDAWLAASSGIDERETGERHRDL